MRSRAEKEVFLQPGGLLLVRPEQPVRTILGSCVAITLWFPSQPIGLICHYVLPTRGERRHGLLDPHYADEAVLLMMEYITSMALPAKACEAKLFGGGRAKAGQPLAESGVGPRNIAAGRELLVRHGITIKCEDVGREVHRSLIFDAATGEVWVRSLPFEGTT